MSAPWYRRIAEGLTRSREELQGHLNVLLQRGPDARRAVLGRPRGRAARGRHGRHRDHGARRAAPRPRDARGAAGRAGGDRPARRGDRRRVPAARTTRSRSGRVDRRVRGRQRHRQDHDRRPRSPRRRPTRAAGSSSAAPTRTGPPRTSSSTCGRSARACPSSRATAGPTPRRSPSTPCATRATSGYDMALIDTAGRLHTAADLMEELSKIVRVVERESWAPVVKLMVLDATTGQNGIAQTRRFDDAVGLDGLVLTKLDGTAKGGVAVAIVRDLGLPIVRIGVGEGIDDLKPVRPAGTSPGHWSGSDEPDAVAPARAAEPSPPTPARGDRIARWLVIPLVVLLVALVIVFCVFFDVARGLGPSMLPDPAQRRVHARSPRATTSPCAATSSSSTSRARTASPIDIIKRVVGGRRRHRRASSTAARPSTGGRSRAHPGDRTPGTGSVRPDHRARGHRLRPRRQPPRVPGQPRPRAHPAVAGHRQGRRSSLRSRRPGCSGPSRAPRRCASAV